MTVGRLLIVVCRKKIYHYYCGEYKGRRDTGDWSVASVRFLCIVCLLLSWRRRRRRGEEIVKPILRATARERKSRGHAPSLQRRRQCGWVRRAAEYRWWSPDYIIDRQRRGPRPPRPEEVSPDTVAAFCPVTSCTCGLCANRPIFGRHCGGRVDGFFVYPVIGPGRRIHECTFLCT